MTNEKAKEWIDKHGKVTEVNVTLFYKIRMKTTKGYYIELGFFKSIIYSLYQKIIYFLRGRTNSIIARSKTTKK